MRIKKIAVYITIVLLMAAVLNIKLPTKQGINYRVRIYKIPLYIKLIEFIDRDYRYKKLSSEIVKGIKDEQDKVIAIFGWVHSNIKTDIPTGWTIYDDHIWHIIIRGYGKSDQTADVFTTLSAYAGTPAGWVRVFLPGGKESLVLSFVKVGPGWAVFDVFNGVYFENDSGAFASLEDIAANRYTKVAVRQNTGVPQPVYEDYFKYMGKYMSDITSRPRKQMPFSRLFYEGKKFFK